jgi:hypothetical protein
MLSHGDAGKAVDAAGRPLAADLVEQVPFLVLSMDLPPAPLYKDALERNIIPQVQLLLQQRAHSGAEAVVTVDRNVLASCSGIETNFARALSHHHLPCNEDHQHAEATCYAHVSLYSCWKLHSSAR